MSNPYQSPSYDPKHFQDAPYQPMAGANDYGWVSQVRIVAVLNAVQGGFEIPIGLMYIGAAFFIPAMMRMDQGNNPNFRNGNGPPEEVGWILFGVYLAMGLPVLLVGILRIWAGVSNYRFRGRMLGLVSLVVGLVSLFSCYCAPTGVAILIYGLIVMLNPAVKMAFEMGDRGMPASQILASFVPYRTQPMDPPNSSWPPQQP